MLILYNKKFIYEYWSRTDLGKRMIESDYVSESDLLFLIPNNVKRMHGLPLTRNSRGKRSKNSKDLRRKHILSYKLFKLIEEIVEETICSHWTNNDFFQEFVDIRDCEWGSYGTLDY